MKKAIFPGTFDPPTKGHFDIIKRAAKLVDKLYIAIAVNTAKKGSCFSTEEKQEMLQKITKKMKNVEVIHFSGLIVDLAQKLSADCIIRGVRAFSDAEHEFSMALANRALSKIETLFLVSDEKLSHISSTLIREIAYFGGSLEEFVPKPIEQMIRKHLKRK